MRSTSLEPSANALPMWTVYDSPTDFPGWFVARMWVAERGEVVATSQVVKALTLDGVRALIPPGLHCLPRMDGDDPKIVEVWF